MKAGDCCTCLLHLPAAPACCTCLQRSAVLARAGAVAFSGHPRCHAIRVTLSESCSVWAMPLRVTTERGARPGQQHRPRALRAARHVAGPGAGAMRRGPRAVAHPPVRAVRGPRPTFRRCGHSMAPPWNVGSMDGSTACHDGRGDQGGDGGAPCARGVLRWGGGMQGPDAGLDEDGSGCVGRPAGWGPQPSRRPSVPSPIGGARPSRLVDRSGRC